MRSFFENRYGEMSLNSPGGYTIGAIGLAAFFFWPDNEPNRVVQPAPKEIVQTTRDSVCQVVPIYSTEELQEREEVDTSFQASQRNLVRHELENKFEGNDGTLSIFYRLNSDTLFGNDLDDLARFVELVGRDYSGPITLEGFADPRGDEEANRLLTDRRISGVEQYLAHRLPDAQITSVSFGENQSEGYENPRNLEERLANRPHRRVTVSTGNAISRGFDVSPSDIYLIDQSGSMNEQLTTGTSKWDAIQSYRFPQDSEVYTFGEIRDCGGELSTEIPSGGTPLYTSLERMIRENPGESITLLTDGYDDSQLPVPQELVDLAITNQTPISVINIGGNPELRIFKDNNIGSYYEQN